MNFLLEKTKTKDSAASGYYSQLAITGKDSVGANIGIGGRIKATIGSWITLAEYDKKGKPLCVKSAKVDGKKIDGNVIPLDTGGDEVDVQVVMG